MRPVFVGDTITVTAVVREKQIRSKSIILDIAIRNQRRQLVTRGEAQVKLLDQVSEHPRSARTDDPEKHPVLVLGGSGGIGGAVAARLAHAGYPIAIHYHAHSERAQKLAQEIRECGTQAITVVADCTDNAQMSDAAATVRARLGSVGALVYAVTAPLEFPDFTDLTWEEMEKALRVDVLGAWNAVQAVLPGMKELGRGSIVLLSSQAVDTPNADWLPYITAKAALEGMARTLAVALAPFGIRVNIVAPGMTETRLIAVLPSLARTRVQSTAPLKRLATPRDVAEAVAFLISDASAYITGETIRVNGGQVMR